MKNLRKILKAFSLILGAVVMVGMILLLLISRGVFNEPLARVISSQAGDQLDAHVEVQELQGNVLSSFSVEGIRVIRRDTTALSLGRLQLDYRLGGLIRKKVHIDRLHLKDLNVYGVQRSDSSWSFQEIFPRGADSEPAEEPAERPVPWEIRLDTLSLEGIAARLKPLDTSIIPSSLHLGGRLGFMMAADSTNSSFMRLSIDSLFFRALSPDLTLSRMRGQIRKTDNRLTWKDVGLDFKETRIRSAGRATLPADDDPDGKAGVAAFFKADPLSLSEFHPWTGTTAIHGDPTITAELEQKADRQHFQMEVKEGDQQISLVGWIGEMQDEPEYQVTLQAEKLDGGHWTRDSLWHSSLTGEIRAKGKGTDFKDNNLALAGDFTRGGFRGYSFEGLSFQLNKSVDTLRGNIQGETMFGEVRSGFRLHQIYQDPLYSIDLALSHLDLSPLLGDTTYRSDLNISLMAEGRHTDPDSIQANVELVLNDSRFMNRPLKDMHAMLEYDRRNYRLRGLDLSSPFFTVNMRGSGNLDGENQLGFEFLAGDLYTFTSRLGLPATDMDGSLTGKAEGTMDSMNITASYRFSRLRYDTLRVNRLEGEIRTLLSLSSSLESGRLQNELDVRLNDALQLDTRTDVIMGQTPLVQIRKVNMQIDTSTWTGGSDSTSIALGRDALDIQHLKLNSGRQEIWADGTLAFQGEEALDVGVVNLDLGQWLSLTSFPHRLGGVLDAGIHLAGTAAEPRLQGDVDIRRPRLDTVQLERLHAGFGYDSSVFTIQGHLDAGLHRVISLQARVPVDLSLADSMVLPGPDTPIRASLMVDSLRAGLANPFLDEMGMQADGLLSASIDVGNTLGKPLYDGKVALDGGTFSYPAEGIRYRDVVISSRFNNQRLQLESAHLRSGEGYLTMEGYVDLPSGHSLTSDSLLIEVNGKDFDAMGSTRLEVTVTPSVTLAGSLAGPSIKGDLTIPRASVNVDALREQMSVKSDDPNPPLLVEALRDTISMETQPDTSRQETLLTGSEFYRNLQGTFNIRIPGNTWVTGNDMNFEVQGDLKAIKERELIDLFGTLNVKRGFFQFYGKKFDFEQGEIIFTGGREINPRVHFVIAYMFRDPDRQRQRLTIEVTGRTRQPNFQFRLNEQVIQEKEALSYLMFGKSTNQLNTSEQVTLEERTGSMARSFALDRVSTAVTRALGAGLGLDMVELEAGKSWKSGNVKIGKYITDDLYLSYQRTFAFDKKEKVIDAERIALEYQIMRFLFLQATNQMYNSGFDLIFKKSWR